MKTVLLGVCGGIAAYKTSELIRRLRGAHINTVVIMTKSATAIIAPRELEKLSGNKVYTGLFPRNFNYKTTLRFRTVDHIKLAREASVFVIVPATANCIAKLAGGIADDFLTTTALAATCPVLICPSMNTVMWFHPATQRNIQTLRTYGYSILDPVEGTLACGDEGKGRLPPVDYIEKVILGYLNTTDDLKGKIVIVTAGGTTEKIDDVRYISNKSSGKMGVAIAESCYLRGANVILLRSETSVFPRYKMAEKEFETADDLEKLIKHYVPQADICIHAAAVSDFALKQPLSGKTSSSHPLPLELTPRNKILDKI
jgi:phosphopantothenoylcysteine decarboxylase/phosphopantothenate--cysteine ligase